MVPQGDMEGAKAQYEQALSVDADFVLAHLNLAHLSVKLNDVGCTVVVSQWCRSSLLTSVSTAWLHSWREQLKSMRPSQGCNQQESRCDTGLLPVLLPSP